MPKTIDREAIAKAIIGYNPEDLSDEGRFSQRTRDDWARGLRAADRVLALLTPEPSPDPDWYTDLAARSDVQS